MSEKLSDRLLLVFYIVQECWSRDIDFTDIPTLSAIFSCSPEQVEAAWAENAAKGFIGQVPPGEST